MLSCYHFLCNFTGKSKRALWLIFPQNNVKIIFKNICENFKETEVCEPVLFRLFYLHKHSMFLWGLGWPLLRHRSIDYHFVYSSKIPSIYLHSTQLDQTNNSTFLKGVCRRIVVTFLDFKFEEYSISWWLVDSSSLYHYCVPFFKMPSAYQALYKVHYFQYL